MVDDELHTSKDKSDYGRYASMQRKNVHLLLLAMI